MAEFLYKGRDLSGRMMQGVVNARSRGDARQRLSDVCMRQQVQLITLRRKATYTYRAQRLNEMPIRGEQRAFSKEEVEDGLRRLDFRAIRVQRKWIEFRLRPPSKDIVMFMRICADLLRERLPYEEILNLLAADTPHPTLSKTIREIQQDLKDGKEGKEVFARHADVLGRFTGYMLGVASTSGNMAEVYESTAKFLERNEEFKKSLRSALLMPAAIVLALIGAVTYYLGYVFPAATEMFLKFGIDLPPVTRATLELSYFLRDNAVWLLSGFLTLIASAAVYLRTEEGRYHLDRLLIRVPVIGPLLHKTSIEIFARVFHALYSGSGENIVLIRIAAEACRNRYIERQVKQIAIPLMLREGRGLVEALEQTDAFTPTAISRFRSGQESGSLRTTALQLANYYERETTYRMKSVVDMMNIAISLVIMGVMMGLTMVSSETAMIRPKSPWMR